MVTKAKGINLPQHDESKFKSSLKEIFIFSV